MEARVEDQQSPFKRRLAKIIEISNEMALNADDSEFYYGHRTNTPGTIFYVFDQSAFEFFINPDDGRRRYPAFFHIEDWRDSDGANRENYWILVNEMLSVLTAEYLFSGRLPGQKNSRIYMTHGHRYEVARSYEVLVKRQTELPDKKAAEHAAIMEQATRCVQDVPTDKDDRDQDLAGDLEQVPPDDRASFLRVRRLARTFALKRNGLVVHQLRRFSSAIWPRIDDVTYQFPLTQQDERMIDAEAGQWASRLRRRQHSGAERPSRGLKRDAR